MTKKRNNYLSLITPLSIIFFVLALIWYRRSRQTSNPNSNTSENFTNSNNTKEHNKLLPIMDPMYNVREITKQMLLLEDHLCQKRKRCMDCIRKHFLTIEGLSEEACSLDKEGKYYNTLSELPDMIRKIEKTLLNGKPKEQIAQDIRNIRKPLVKLSFDKFNC